MWSIASVMGTSLAKAIRLIIKVFPKVSSSHTNKIKHLVTKFIVPQLSLGRDVERQKDCIVSVVYSNARFG